MNNILSKILNPTHIKKVIFFLVFDLLIIAISLYLSFLLRFDFSLSAEYRNLILKSLPIFIFVKLIVFAGFRLYKMTWRYVGIADLCNIVYAIIVANSVLMILILIPVPQILFLGIVPQFNGYPRSIFLIDGAISLSLVSGIRLFKRLVLEIVLKNRSKVKGQKTIIIGAGNTGEMILRDIVRQDFSEFYPVALLDDDKDKIGAYVHGVKVFGKTDDLKTAVTRFKAEAVIIAIPFLNHKTLKNIYNLAKEYKVKTVKIVPRIYDFHKPAINLKSLEEISIEDIIGRQAVTVNYDEIESFLNDKTILVTGAGGSIGSEIVMQICTFHPRRIVLFDIDETGLHNMHLKLGRVFPNIKEKIFFLAGDVRDENRIDEIFRKFSPEIVFHSAAYKHVPMMEYNPKEAVKVNMFGTYVLAKTSVYYGVKKFIMISTDKAVRPTSIMGATKRMAEYICKAFSAGEKTEFVSVRFGNVLGSRGSVLPLFMEQLKYGGPLTVTHRDMQRYFMTIPEAVSLVLQAAVIGNNGEVLVLDMGEPVRIVELAEELIKIHGLEPYKDMDIEFIGLRPGEKLFEEILTAEEGTVASKHEKVFIAKNNVKFALDEMSQIMESFKAVLHKSPIDDERGIRELLQKHVKHFCDKNRV